MTSLGGLTSALGFLLSPIGLVVAAIAAAIAIGVVLYKNWDAIKARVLKIWATLQAQARAKWAAIKTAVITPIQNAKARVVAFFQSMRTNIATKVDAIKNKISATFSAIKKKITDPIQKAKDKISEIIQKIKDFFPIHIGKIFSGIQIPKFSLKGKFSAKKGTVPQVGYSWANIHAAGGIFDRPTLLRSRGGFDHVVGEAGAEAILPLSQLWAQMDRMADSIVNGVARTAAIAGAGNTQPTIINLYAFPGGPQLQRFVVETYDTGKQRLG